MASPARRRRRLLLVTYTFPPVGGAGVQRVAKFVKYLPRHGWSVTVLTAANPSVPLFDHSFEKDIPSETVIHRARTLEPGYAVKAAVSSEGAAVRRRRSVRGRLTGALRRAATLALQPDAQILWLPKAVSLGKRALREVRHDAILVSGPPFSSFLIAAKLSRFARLPLVLDYRDEWSLSNSYWENKQFGRVSTWIQGWMQQRVVRAAAGLLATTRASAEALREVHSRAGGAGKVSWIYNGFDPDDFECASTAPSTSDRPFRLVFIGTLWNLTSVEPLVEAVRKLCRNHPNRSAAFELTFAGRKTPQQSELLMRLRGLPCRFVDQPYVDHSAAIELVQGADALCLLLSDLPGAGRVVPAKLFEYFATGLPILHIGPRGETWDLLESYPNSVRFLPKDLDGIEGWLAAAIDKREAGTLDGKLPWDASAFDRNYQAKQLAGFLDSLLE